MSEDLVLMKQILKQPNIVKVPAQNYILSEMDQAKLMTPSLIQIGNLPILTNKENFFTCSVRGGKVVTIEMQEEELNKAEKIMCDGCYRSGHIHDQPQCIGQLLRYNSKAHLSKKNKHQAKDSTRNKKINKARGDLENYISNQYKDRRRGGNNIIIKLIKCGENITEAQIFVGKNFAASNKISTIDLVNSTGEVTELVQKINEAYQT